MGCVKSKTKRKRFPGQRDPVVLASETAFSPSDVEALAELFRKISSSIVDDGKISKEEFKLAMNFKTTETEKIFGDRIFDLFDVTKQGMIYFDAFVKSLNVFHPNTPLEQKIDFSFKVYDLNDNGFIEREEVKKMFIITLDEFKADLTDEAIETILDKTFLDADLNKDGQIDIDEWRSFVAKNPSLIKNMTIDHLREATTYFPSFIFNTTLDDDQVAGPSNA